MMTTSNQHTYFIVPAYNEGLVIRSVIMKLLKEFPNVICVDDGSTDNTLEEIKYTSARVIQHPINMGQGAAIQTGIEFARGFKNAKYFVTFDADGQHRIEDVMQMIELLKNGEADIVLGSRFMGEAIDMPKPKRILLKIAIKFSNTISGINLTDTHNGLRAFNRHVAENIQITMSDMAHASEFLEIIREKNFKYKEVPVTITYTEYSRNKGQSVLNAINIAFDVMLRRISR